LFIAIGLGWRYIGGYSTLWLMKQWKGEKDVQREKERKKERKIKGGCTDKVRSFDAK